MREWRTLCRPQDVLGSNQMVSLILAGVFLWCAIKCYCGVKGGRTGWDGAAH